MEKRLFVNVSNHPSDLWGSRQIESAQKYGTIVDIPFPKVDANADESEIRNIAEQKYNEILQVYRNSDGEFEEKGSSQYGAAVKGLTVMVQGEFTVTYLLVGLLKRINADVVAACAERVVHEEQMENGKSRKLVEFEFVRFRKYA